MIWSPPRVSPGDDLVVASNLLNVFGLLLRRCEQVTNGVFVLVCSSAPCYHVMTVTEATLPASQGRLHDYTLHSLRRWSSPRILDSIKLFFMLCLTQRAEVVLLRLRMLACIPRSLSKRDAPVSTGDRSLRARWPDDESRELGVDNCVRNDLAAVATSSKMRVPVWTCEASTTCTSRQLVTYSCTS